MLYGAFLSHRATPSHHPFLDGIFPFTKTIQPASLGTPVTQLPPPLRHPRCPTETTDGRRATEPSWPTENLRHRHPLDWKVKLKFWKRFLAVTKNLQKPDSGSNSFS